MFLQWAFRKVFLIPSPKITRKEAIEIARALCDNRGWTMANPTIIEGLRTWLIYTKGDSKGSPWVVIDQQTGIVVRSGCPPR